MLFFKLNCYLSRIPIYIMPKWITNKIFLFFFFCHFRYLYSNESALNGEEGHAKWFNALTSLRLYGYRFSFTKATPSILDCQSFPDKDFLQLLGEAQLFYSVIYLKLLKYFAIQMKRPGSPCEKSLSVVRALNYGIPVLDNAP